LTDYDQLSTSQSPFFYDKQLSAQMDIYPAGGAFPALREDGYGVYYLFLGDDFSTYMILYIYDFSVELALYFVKALVMSASMING